MYLEYFGLREMPFSLTPGTAFAFASRAHQEALNTLLVAVQGGEGFVKITGEVGTGKTLLCRRFLAVMEERNAATAYVPNPLLDRQLLLLSVARELGLKVSGKPGEYDLMRWLNLALLKYAELGRPVVVCIDEAQALPDTALEAVRLLSNFETERKKLLQVVMFGQPELDEKLDTRELRQLRQRISFGYELGGMSAREVERYLAHRLGVAGYGGKDLFTPAAVHLMHEATEGVPRLVNIIAHKALLSVFGEGLREVARHHIRAAVADTPAARSLSRLHAWRLRSRQWANRLGLVRG